MNPSVGGTTSILGLSLAAATFAWATLSAVTIVFHGLMDNVSLTPYLTLSAPLYPVRVNNGSASRVKPPLSEIAIVPAAGAVASKVTES